MKHLKPRDIVALAGFIVVIIMVVMEQMQGVTEIITGIIAYYFGHRHSGVDDGE